MIKGDYYRKIAKEAVKGTNLVTLGINSLVTACYHGNLNPRLC